MAETDEKIAEIGIIAETEKKISEIGINAETEKKTVKIGINGLGLFGKMLATAIVSLEGELEVELVAMNQLLYTIHSDTVVCGEKQIPLFCRGEPENIPWGSVGAEYVVECSGLFTEKRLAIGHLKAGAKKVIIAGKSRDVPMFIKSVNEDELKPHIDVVCTGSYICNCLAPLVKVINDRYGVIEGFATTIQSDLDVQNFVDQRLRIIYPDRFVARRAFLKKAFMYPRYSKYAEEVGKVIPFLDGKMGETSFYIGNLNVSVVDLSLKIEKSTTYEDVKNTIKEECNRNMRGTLGFEDEDDTHIPGSSTVVAYVGSAPGDNFVKVVAQNTVAGYCNQVVELIIALSQM